MSKREEKEKFKFGLDFQEAILKYTVTDKQGYRALELYSDTYFELISHQLIAFTLKRYYKKKKRIPGVVVLKENLRQVYNHRNFKGLITKELTEDVENLLNKLYVSTPLDGDDILEEVIKFAQFTELKDRLDSADVTDFSQYEQLQKDIRKAINIGADAKKHRGIRLIKDAENRVANRNSETDVFHTPYWQFNRSQNGGGIKKHALVMLMSEAKRYKTGSIINFCLACLRRKKKGIYFDLENGEDQLATRSDQSLIKATQKDIKSGEMDKKLLKQIRKYRRIGAELVIVRLPALSTTTADLQRIVDDYRLDEGLTFDFAAIDYGDLLGALSGKNDDTERISDGFLDMKNFAVYNDFDFIATASHVKREAAKRRDTKYVAGDVAKCIDKIRHLDICIGLQENEEEIANGVMRWEIIEQRDGPQNFTMYFWVDIEHQKLREFTKQEVKNLGNQTEAPTTRKKPEADI